METLRVERRDAIAILTVSRPKVLNALNQQVLAELDTVLTELEQDPALRGLVVTGEGEKAFVAGADISEFQGVDPKTAREMSARGQDLFRRLETLPFPSIAVINGFALGGGLELAMSCTFRYAVPGARVGQPEVKLGLIPGYAGTQRLARLVGRSKAMEICMTARMVGADEALQIGIVDRIISEGSPVDAAVDALNQVQANAPLAVAWCKEAILDGLEMPFDDACRLEADLFGRCFESDDMKEGVSAFLEKRPPEFKGN